MAMYEHIGLIYNKFTFDQHGIKLEDVNKTNRQNWASAQPLCQEKVRNCLRLLRTSRDVHQERTLDTKTYLEVFANYIDIFCSTRLNLQKRVVLATKVSFFF